MLNIQDIKADRLFFYTIFETTAIGLLCALTGRLYPVSTHWKTAATFALAASLTNDLFQQNYRDKAPMRYAGYAVGALTGYVFCRLTSPISLAATAIFTTVIAGIDYFKHQN